MPASDSAAPISRTHQVHAVTASFLGWTLDAFDFFVVVFLVDTLAAQFHVTKMCPGCNTENLVNRTACRSCSADMSTFNGMKIPRLSDAPPNRYLKNIYARLLDPAYRKRRLHPTPFSQSASIPATG